MTDSRVWYRRSIIITRRVSDGGKIFVIRSVTLNRLSLINPTGTSYYQNPGPIQIRYLFRHGMQLVPPRFMSQRHAVDVVPVLQVVLVGRDLL